MSFINKDIVITDWVGNQLYIGPYDDADVDKILDANRCKYCMGDEPCMMCNSTGYAGDFEVYWSDESDKKDCNVYTYINY